MADDNVAFQQMLKDLDNCVDLLDEREKKWFASSMDLEFIMRHQLKLLMI